MARRSKLGQTVYLTDDGVEAQRWAEAVEAVRTRRPTTAFYSKAQAKARRRAAAKRASVSRRNNRS